MGKLSALSAKTISEPGRYGDGDGLYLNVATSGTKSWVQRIVINEKRRDIGLGSYPAISLAQARSLAAGNRSAVAEGRRSPRREAGGQGVRPQSHSGSTRLRRGRCPRDRTAPAHVEKPQTRCPVASDTSRPMPSR